MNTEGPAASLGEAVAPRRGIIRRIRDRVRDFPARPVLIGSICLPVNQASLRDPLQNRGRKVYRVATDGADIFVITPRSRSVSPL